MHVRGRLIRAILLAFVGIAAGVFYLATLELVDNPIGSARLVSIQHMPELSELCLPEETSGSGSDPVLARVYAQDQTMEVSRQPVRRIMDLDPIYSYVAVDTQTDEVFLQDINTWSIRVFSRLENTPPGAVRSEPKRVISGDKTDIQFNTCIYIDPKNGDIYTVENDIGDSVVVFSRNAEGDVQPIRQLNVTHRAYALAVDEEKQELFVSVQYPPQVEVYRKTAAGDEKPLRVLSGESTRLSDAHGIAIDQKNKLLFVANWGNVSDYRIAGSGRYEPPSISVYPLDASGDASPLRVIQGEKTQLNWPGTMSLDPGTGDLFIANDAGHSILVFRGTDRGDVAPSRVIKGDRSGVNSPTGVFVDAKNKELWVSNMGNASATVYPLNANGNVPPLRTIRSAPANKVSLRFGKTQALVYDSKREEILVPN